MTQVKEDFCKKAEQAKSEDRCLEQMETSCLQNRQNERTNFGEGWWYLELIEQPAGTGVFIECYPI